MSLKVITPPTVEPVSLEEARLHLRLDTYDSPPAHPDDELVESLITAAREWAENFTGRALAPQTLELALDEFPADEIELQRVPVTSITSVTYVDTDGATQTLSNTLYTLDNYSEPSWLLPAVDTEWPETGEVVNTVKIRYVVGYSARTDADQANPLPKSFKQAMLLLIGHWYKTREDSSSVKLESVPMGAESLLRPYRLYTGMA